MARAGRGFPVSPQTLRGALAPSALVMPAAVAGTAAVPTPAMAPGTTATPARINALAALAAPPIGVSFPTSAAARTVLAIADVPQPNVTPASLTTPGEVDPEYAWVHSISVLSSKVPVWVGAWGDDWGEDWGN